MRGLIVDADIPYKCIIENSHTEYISQDMKHKLLESHIYYMRGSQKNGDRQYKRNWNEVSNP